MLHLMLDNHSLTGYKVCRYFTSETKPLHLREIILEPVQLTERARFKGLMDAHQYPGRLPKIGHTVW